MRPWAIGAALLMFGITGTAASAKCGDLPTQAEMNQCAAQAYAQADRELNELYKKYMARLSDEQQRQLRDAQLAWIRFRDLSCGFESAGVKGGSTYPFVLSSCLARMTRARVQQLGALANCKEGDLSCPAGK